MAVTGDKLNVLPLSRWQILALASGMQNESNLQNENSAYISAIDHKLLFHNVIPIFETALYTAEVHHVAFRNNSRGDTDVKLKFCQIDSACIRSDSNVHLC